ncbi:U3 ribonucleoprotein (Utp) family protein isoform X2 [Tasmannia lanceolata]|uniref:U3 ribonucleoprotein (Utp) family protein isoform X2 n=1 Tax=Tasmannia lanceolata TaxID=3420 RepID=UPI0040648706
MAEKKRKLKGEEHAARRKKIPKTLTLGKKKKRKNKDEGGRKKGPFLPSVLRKELDLINPNPRNSDDEIDSDEGERNDVYEYDEPIAEEESKKNRRFDPVDNLEYELADDFKDENLPSSDDEGYDGKGNDTGDFSDHSEDEVGEDDNGRHARMLQGIIGMPDEVFEGKKRKKASLSGTDPESEYNLKALDGDGRISIQDLLDPLHGKPGYSKLRKRMHELEKHSMSIHAPLPKPEREKLERKAAYEQSKKDITKWEPLVKRNREAPTIYFDEDTDLRYSTVGAIASEFEPRTEFEKKIASLVSDSKVMEAHKNDGARLLELNKISVEDVRDRQNRLAKMRSLLFRHEMKAKHIKKIKSKTYHRMLKKDRMKAASAEMQMDSEAAKEYALKQEFRRAEERMTLKHKNSSKWAKRILKRGLKTQDEGTRAAITEQLHQHSLLTRKMNSMKDTSSSDDSSDGDDEVSGSSEGEEASKILKKAKEKILKVVEEEDEIPKSGVLALPFMVRGLKKRKEAAYEEAQLALQEYDSSLRQLEDTDEVESPKLGTSSGRRVFGAGKKLNQEVSNGVKPDNIDRDNESEDDFEAKENVDLEQGDDVLLREEIRVDPGPLLEESGIGQEAVFKSFNDIIRDHGPKTTYEVAIIASDSRRKIRSENGGNKRRKSSFVEEASSPQDLKGAHQDSDTDSEEEMVDGILSSGAILDYELPSQADLIQHAFAGDDVEGEFEKDKLEILNEEVPEPEKPVLLPGWGQWTHVQQKKGLPSWIVKEHEDAKKKREEALKKRKDARLKHVIISEKNDKKAEKLLTKTLPFPFTSKEVFEQSIRMPIGPEYNPATSVGALNRPQVVKKAGVIIKPIKFEEVNPHDKLGEPSGSRHAPKTKKDKSNGGKSIKKMTKKKKS